MALTLSGAKVAVVQPYWPLLECVEQDATANFLQKIDDCRAFENASWLVDILRAGIGRLLQPILVSEALSLGNWTFVKNFGFAGGSHVPKRKMLYVLASLGVPFGIVVPTVVRPASPRRGWSMM